MKCRNIFTGSCETEQQLYIFCNAANSLDDGVPRKLFKDEHMWEVMTKGRNGPNDTRPRSTAFDDTGGFFIKRDDKVFLSEKAKSCISI